MRKELSKTYSPKEFEGRIYKAWEEAGYFRAEINPEKKPYTIVIPPPNITGQLHMGHALNNTYQDILIRWRRMQGYAALWVPGTDHASIATEARIVSAMKEEGITKEALGREGFLERAWEWYRLYGGRIITQLKSLGSSCDWSRTRFTLDEGCSAAVRKVFVRLYENGKIYHGVRIINWCVNCRTSISDIECEYEEKAGSFWHIKYPLSDGSGFVVIATTRPETLLGDTAVAVHPGDERYQKIIGKMVKLPLTGREIPVVADEYVDRDFGTGVVKITPAHDPNDFEVGLRHNLPRVNIMEEDGKINATGGRYEGMERYAARKAIVADLEAAGLLVKTEEHTHNVGTCQRCGTVVEPRASLQWFVKMEELAKPAIDVVKNGEIKMIPARFENNYLGWMENIRDWCISRQLWWGHRIPAYYCQNPACAAETISAEDITACPKCGGAVKQDEDTLDTWFSSALWPFSTLGWPEETPELDYFYPTSTLVTASDIIFFWVARMIFSGLDYTGKIPFSTVLFNGIVQDEHGKKMSKSSGNGVDPLEVIEKYGADALRLTLVSGNTPGNNMRWSEAKITAYRNFANKLWNASRYILMNLPEGFEDGGLPEKLALEDKWVLSLLDYTVRGVTHSLEQFELGLAAGETHDFIWDVYCDWYIELTKSRIAEGGAAAETAQRVLLHVMRESLKLLHPFMPFITEEIWSALPGTGGISIMVAEWPQPGESFTEERRTFQKIADAISAVRSKRSELNVPMSKKVPMTIEVAREDLELFRGAESFFRRLAGGDRVTVLEKVSDTAGMAIVVTDAARIFMPMGELVDLDKKRESLEKEKSGVQKDIDFLSKKLSNPGFLAKAPAAQVEAERAKLAKAEEKMAKLLESIHSINET